MTAQAGAITALYCFARCGEEIDILRCWLFCGAGRPAEDSCRTYPDKKYSFKARIAIQQRAIHCFGRRKKFHCFHVNKLNGRVRRRIDEIRAMNLHQSSRAQDWKPKQTARTD